MICGPNELTCPGGKDIQECPLEDFCISMFGNFYFFWGIDSTGHYLMGLGSNIKKIPQNSGNRIRISEGMQFNNLLSIKFRNVHGWPHVSAR